MFDKFARFALWLIVETYMATDSFVHLNRSPDARDGMTDRTQLGKDVGFERSSRPYGVATSKGSKHSYPLGRGNNRSSNDFGPLLTKQDACAYLRCTARYLERMVRSGRLRALKPSPRFVRFRRVDIDSFLESGATICA